MQVSPRGIQRGGDGGSVAEETESNLPELPVERLPCYAFPFLYSLFVTSFFHSHHLYFLLLFSSFYLTFLFSLSLPIFSFFSPHFPHFQAKLESVTA